MPTRDAPSDVEVFIEIVDFIGSVVLTFASRPEADVPRRACVALLYETLRAFGMEVPAPPHVTAASVHSLITLLRGAEADNQHGLKNHDSWVQIPPAQPDPLPLCGAPVGDATWRCTRHVAHGGDHIATIGPYAPSSVVLARWQQP